MRKLKKLALLTMCAVMLLSPIIIQPGMEDTAYAASKTFTKTINFDETTDRSRTRTIEIPYLDNIQSVSVDNGDVSYNVSGENVTFNVKNGDWINRESYYDPKKYSKYERDSRTSSNNSFPSSVSYSDSSGYTGNLSQNGSPDVISGIYLPYDTKYVSGQYSRYYDRNGYSGSLDRYLYSGYYRPSDSKRVTSGGGSFTWGHYCNTTVENGIKYKSKASPSSTSYYNSGGYSGTLYYYERMVSHPDSPADCFGTTVYRYKAVYSYSGTVYRPAKDTREYRYRGTVTRPESDTRIWKQDYSGTVYKGGTSYRNHAYAYTVTINYKLTNFLLAEILHTEKWANKLNIPRESPNFVAGESYVIKGQTTSNTTKVVVIPPKIIADKQKLNLNADNTRWKTTITPKEPHKLEKDSYTFKVKATFENGQVLAENVTIHIGGEVQTNIHLTQ